AQRRPRRESRRSGRDPSPRTGWRDRDRDRSVRGASAGRRSRPVSGGACRGPESRGGLLCGSGGPQRDVGGGRMPICGVPLAGIRGAGRWERLVRDARLESVRGARRVRNVARAITKLVIAAFAVEIGVICWMLALRSTRSPNCAQPNVLALLGQALG